MTTGDVFTRVGEQGFYKKLIEQAERNFGWQGDVGDPIHDMLLDLKCKEIDLSEYDDPHLITDLVCRARHFSINKWRRGRRFLNIEPQENDEGDEGDDDYAIAQLIQDHGMFEEQEKIAMSNPARIYEQQCEQEEMWQKFFSALNKKERPVFEYLRDGYTPERIAQLMNIKVDAVYKRIQRGRIAIRQLFSK
jgi:hypothetical protein